MDFLYLAGTLTVIFVVILGVCVFLLWRCARTEGKMSLPNTLLDIIEHVQGAKYEMLFVVDRNGEIVFEETQYQPERVDLTEEQHEYMRAHPGLVEIHNHNDDTPPSLDDLIMSASDKCSECMVIGTEHLYSVRPVKDWRSDAEMYQLLEKHKHLATSEVVENRCVGQYPDGSLLIETIESVKSTEEFLQKITKDAGYIYEKMRL